MKRLFDKIKRGCSFSVVEFEIFLNLQKFCLKLQEHLKEGEVLPKHFLRDTIVERVKTIYESYHHEGYRLKDICHHTVKILYYEGDDAFFGFSSEGFINRCFS